MLLEFSVENYLSFKNKVTFNMSATSISEHQDTHIVECGNFKLLKSAVVYGANAGGKSNLLLAMNRMKSLIMNSSKESQATEDLDVESFKLNITSENKPSMFEIVFIHQNILYRYGFVTDKKRIFEEWLYHRPQLNKNKEKILFLRDHEKIEIKPKTVFSEEAKGLENKTRKNALFISVVANFNGKIATSILEWMDKFDFLSGTDNSTIGYTARMLENPEQKEKILGFIRAADFDIEDLKLESANLERLIQNQFPKELVEKLSSAQVVTSLRKKFNENNEPVGFTVFDVIESESEGTKKFLSLAGPILEKLHTGGVLVIDELDAKLHPLLTKKIIDMFQSYDINTHNAQLIFATHDVTNLNKETFRRDQVWFAEKDPYGATDLYSLVEYKLDSDEKKVRKDASYGKDYLLGKYGGIPNLGNLHLFLEESVYGNR